MEQFYRLNKVAYHNSANCNFVSFDFTKDIHIAGRNNLGKTAKLNGIQIGYLPHATFKGATRKFNFDKDYTEDASFDFYFPENNSYIIYEFENPHGTFCQIVYKGNGDLQIERAFIPKSYNEILHWFWLFGDSDEVGLPTRISRKDFLKEVGDVQGSKIIKSAPEAKNVMYNGSLTNYDLGKFSVASVDENRIDNILDILKLTSNASSIDSEMLRKIIISLLKTSYQDNERDSMQYNPVELLDQFTRIKNDREILTKKKNYLSLHQEVKSAYTVLNHEVARQNEIYNYSNQSLDRLIRTETAKLTGKQVLKESKDDTITSMEAVGRELNGNISEIKGQLTQLKKTITQRENLEQKYQELMFGSDSPWMLYNGDHERVLEEIEILITEYTDEIQAIEDIENTVRDLEKEQLNLSSLIRKKSNIETQIKNIENLFISNEKIKGIAGKLQAINPSFSALSNNISEENIEKIIEFTGIFEEVNGQLVIDEVRFGRVGSPVKSINDLTVELNDTNIEIGKTNSIIEKLKKITESEDTKLMQKTKEDLSAIKKERDIINKYQSIKDELHDTKKERSEFEKAFDEATKKYADHKETYKQEKKIRADLNDEIKPLRKDISDYRVLQKELDTESRANNYTYSKSHIEDSDLYTSTELINLTEIKSRFAKIKSAKGCIIVSLRELVEKQILDDEQALLVRATLDYDLINEVLVSQLTTIFDSIDADEEELNKAFSRQAKLIMDLSGDLNHYLGRYKSYIRKLNKQLDDVNLSSISRIEIKAEFEPRVERFIEVIEQFGLSSDDAITSMDNGLEEQIRSFIKDMHLEKSKNMAINVETLIKKISLKYINENNFVTTKGSNGTSMITSIILISMFTREICGDEVKILMPINLDEIGSVDWNNTKTVYDFIKSKGFCLFSAAPTVPNTAINMFDVVIPLEDFEFVENAEVFLSNYRMTYHYRMGGMIDEDEEIIEIDSMDDFDESNSELVIEHDN